MKLRAVSIVKADNTAFTNREYLYYLNVLNPRNITLNLRAKCTTEIQGSSEFLRAKQEKLYFHPGKHQSLMCPGICWGKEEFKTGRPGTDFYSQPRITEVFKRQSCVRLTKERKEKSQGENSFLLHPVMNSGSSRRTGLQLFFISQALRAIGLEEGV